MKKANIKIKYPEKFEIDETIEILVNFSKKKHEIYKTTITKRMFEDKYYLMFDRLSNDQIFVDLNIDKEYFCHKLLNMKKITGIWPETNSLSELKYMLKVLEHINEF